jgi:hypothetical protein
VAARDSGGVSLGLLTAKSADRRQRSIKGIGNGRVVRELQLPPAQHPFRKHETGQGFGSGIVFIIPIHRCLFL